MKTWLAFLLSLISWTILLLTPEPARLSRGWLTPELATILAKILHFLAYLVLAWLALKLPLSSNPGARGWILAFLVAHAAGTEYAQQFIELRSASLHDVGIDLCGIAAGVFLTIRMKRARRPAAQTAAVEDSRSG